MRAVAWSCCRASFLCWSATRRGCPTAWPASSTSWRARLASSRAWPVSARPREKAMGRPRGNPQDQPACTGRWQGSVLVSLFCVFFGGGLHGHDRALHNGTHAARWHPRHPADACKADQARVEARMPNVEALLGQLFTSAVPEWRNVPAGAATGIGAPGAVALPAARGVHGAGVRRHGRPKSTACLFTKASATCGNATPQLHAMGTAWARARVHVRVMNCGKACQHHAALPPCHAQNLGRPPSISMLLPPPPPVLRTHATHARGRQQPQPPPRQAAPLRALCRTLSA